MDACAIYEPPSRSNTPTTLYSQIFRATFYPDTTDAEWNNWRWQLKNTIRSSADLKRIFDLLPEEEAACETGTSLPLAITPYYAGVVYQNKETLRKAVIPTSFEYLKTKGEADDPLHEDKDSPVPCIVHRYPDRVLFLTTNTCASYCRYCTRSRMVAKDNTCISTHQWEKAIEYIASKPQIRDVLLSGGDPLTLPDEKIELLLDSLRKIEHVQIIRIGTKVPVVLPQRITPALTRMLRKYRPLLISIHFTHPGELTKETVDACGKLADVGIPLGSQTVLLADINNDIEVMKELMHKLLMACVKPYYLYQCDPITGSFHFRTKVEKGIEIIRNLRGFTSGYAVPTFVIDAPGGGGKIPIMPDYVMGQDDEGIKLMNYEGKSYKYPQQI